MSDRSSPDPIRIVAIGEALIDIVQTDTSISEHPGGSPMNVAFGLGRLGEHARLLTSIGDDARGRAIASHLDSAGVALVDGSIAAGRTSTAIARLDGDGAARYEFDIRWELPEGQTPSPTGPDADWARADLIHIGSIGSFLEPGASTVERLVTALRPSTLVTFDPNVRPALVDGAAVALARFERLAASADLVKLSDEDAAWLYPDANVEAVLTHLFELGVVVAAVTLGANGAILATRDARVDVPGVAVTVADTIGAGDSFMSALVHRLARLLAAGTTRDAVRDGSAVTPEVLAAMGFFAVDCAAITVSRPGANPPTLAEVNALPAYAGASPTIRILPLPK